jgi:hypothetical protein
MAAAGRDRAFVAKLDAKGALVWNTFLGGKGTGGKGITHGFGIAVDANGAVYVVGRGNNSCGRPVRAYSAGADAFVARLAGASGALVWSTFLGGRENDQANAIAVDGNGNLLVAGASGGAWGSPVRGYTEGGDAFVVKLSAATARPLN